MNVYVHSTLCIVQWWGSASICTKVSTEMLKEHMDVEDVQKQNALSMSGRRRRGVVVAVRICIALLAEPGQDADQYRTGIGIVLSTLTPY